MDKNEVKNLYETTEITLQEIADKVGSKLHQVWKLIASEYSVEFRAARKTNCYRNSKLGNKNPMAGKVGENHHGFVGDVSDGKGYMMRLKPEWYTGRKGCKHVFVHHVVMCEALGLTEIPRGWCVHHIDGDKVNNNPNNLAFLTIAAHTRLHQLERATTIPKGSRV